MNPTRTARSRFIRVLSSTLVLVSWTMGSSLAEAACLTGPGLTGFESGNQTLSVSIPNTAAFTEVVGTSCTESAGIVSPGSTEFGTGQARFIASSLGYCAQTSSFVGGEGSGSGGATVGGSVRYLVRVNSTPSYSGPAIVSLVVSMRFAASGNVTASGVASAGGVYSTDVHLTPADTPFGAVLLFVAGSGLAPGGSVILENSTPIDIDRDYILQIAHTQNVTTSFAPGPMGDAGSAASSGTVVISFESELALVEPELSVEYPMVALLGVDAPSLGNPLVCQFSSAVPSGGVVPGSILVLLLTWVTWAATSKLSRGC